MHFFLYTKNVYLPNKIEKEFILIRKDNNIKDYVIDNLRHDEDNKKDNDEKLIIINYSIFDEYERIAKYILSFFFFFKFMKIELIFWKKKNNLFFLYKYLFNITIHFGKVFHIVHF